MYALSADPSLPLSPSWHVTPSDATSASDSTADEEEEGAASPVTVAQGAREGVEVGGRDGGRVGHEGVTVVAVVEGSETSGAVVASALSQWLFGSHAVMAAMGPRQ